MNHSSVSNAAGETLPPVTFQLASKLSVPAGAPPLYRLSQCVPSSLVPAWESVWPSAPNDVVRHSQGAAFAVSTSFSQRVPLSSAMDCEAMLPCASRTVPMADHA